MWVRTRESLVHVSELVDDLRTASHESGIMLDDGDRERLTRISAIVNDYYEILFPYDYPRGNPWTRANGTKMGVALALALTVCWSVLRGRRPYYNPLHAQV